MERDPDAARAAQYERETRQALGNAFMHSVLLWTTVSVGADYILSQTE